MRLSSANKQIHQEGFNLSQIIFKIIIIIIYSLEPLSKKFGLKLHLNGQVFNYSTPLHGQTRYTPNKRIRHLVNPYGFQILELRSVSLFSVTYKPRILRRTINHSRAVSNLPVKYLLIPMIWKSILTHRDYLFEECHLLELLSIVKNQIFKRHHFSEELVSKICF